MGIAKTLQLRGRRVRAVARTSFVAVGLAWAQRAAPAAENTWIGAASGNWSSASAWSAGVVPQADHDVFIDGGRPVATTVTLTGSSQTSIRTLSISAGDRLTVNAVGATHELRLAGPALVNAGTITMTYTGSSGFPVLRPLGPGDLVLSGGGTLVMNGAGVTGPGRFVNRDNTILLSGASIGLFGPGMLNEGTIIGVPVGGSVVSTVQASPSAPMENRGTLRATNQTILSLNGNNGGRFINTLGRMEAITSGAIALERGARVVGGTVGPGSAYVQGTEWGAIENVASTAEWSINGSLTLAGAIQHSGSGFVHNSGVLIPQGTVTLGGAGSWQLLGGRVAAGTGSPAAALVNLGNTVSGFGEIGQDTLTIENQAAGRIIARNGTLTLDPRGGSVLLNAGTASADGAATVLALSGSGGGSFLNAGTVLAINGGTVRLLNGAALGNLAGETLTGGTWDVGGDAEIDLAGATVTVNAASVRLTGAASRFAAMDALEANTGSLTFADRRDFTAAASFVNRGFLSVGAGCDLTVPSNFEADAVAATLHFEIASTDAERYGQIAVNGTAELDGTLRVTLTNFTPSLGNVFRLLSAGSVTGRFDAAELPALGGNRFFELVYMPAEVQLRVVPEPAAGSAAATLLCAAGLVRTRRWKTRGTRG